MVESDRKDKTGGAEDTRRVRKRENSALICLTVLLSGCTTAVMHHLEMCIFN